MPVADEVVLQFTAKLEAYRAEVRKTADEFKSNMEHMERSAAHAESILKSSFERVKRSLEVFGIGLGIREIGRQIGEAVDKVAEIQQFADAIGISTKAMQAMDRIAVKLGASTEELQRGLKRVATQAGEPGSFIQKLFAANNVQVSDNAETNIRHFMDLVRNASTQTERLVLVSQVVGGRASAAMVEAFSQGSEAIDKTFADLEHQGLAHSEAQIKYAMMIRNKYREYMDDIAQYWETLVVNMLAASGRFVSTTSNQINDYKRELLKQRKGELEKNPNDDNRILFDFQYGLKGSGADKIKRIDELRAQLAEERQRVGREAFDIGRGTNTGTGKEGAGTGSTVMVNEQQEKLSKAIEQTTRETEREIQALKDEADAFGKTTFEIVRQKKEREILAKLEDDHRKEGGATTPEEIARAHQLAEEYARVTAALQENKTELQNLKDASDTVFNDMESSIDKLIDTGKFSFKSFVESAIKDLAKLGVHNLLGQLEGDVSGSNQGTGLLGMLTRALFGPAKVPNAVPLPHPISHPSPLSQVPGVADVVAPVLPSAGPSWPVDAVTSRVLGTIGGAADKSDMSAMPSSGMPFTDLLSKVESGSRGYDSVMGGTQFTGGKQYDVSKMTIGEVRALQDRVRAQTRLLPPTNKFYNSSAMGQYQIVGTTLRGEQDRLGLEDSTLFNKPIQDMMGADLARQTGGNIDKIHSMWTGTKNLPDDKVLTAWSDQFGSSMTKISQTAAKSAESFTSTVPTALSNIASALTGVNGAGSDSGVGAGLSMFGNLGSIFSEHTGSFAGAMAGGGHMEPGHSYLVGENAPEIVTPKMPMTVHPLEGRGGARVHVVPSKYFDVIVEETANRSSRGMAKSIRKNFPAFQSSYRNLGTV